MGVCSECNLRTVSQDCKCLQHQLREAQEERGQLRRILDGAAAVHYDLRAERDAAIERGLQVWDYALCSVVTSYFLGVAVVEWKKRAEAAGEEAKAQRALAERRDKGMWLIVQIFLNTLWHGEPPNIWFNEAHRRDVLAWAEAQEGGD